MSVVSVLDAKAMGGLHAWSGFTAQVRFAVLSLSKWLNDPEFAGFTLEQNEDIDLFLESSGAHFSTHYQLKLGNQAPADVKALVSEFTNRYSDKIQRNLVRHFVIGSPHASETVRSAFAALAAYRVSYLGGDDAQKQATLADVKARFVPDIVRDADFDFLLEHVDLEHSWEASAPSWSACAGMLGAFPEFKGYTVDELTIAAEKLAMELTAAKRYHWTRSKILAVVHDSVRNAHSGPATSDGDRVELCHQTFAYVRSHPRGDALQVRIRARRPVQLTVDAVTDLENGNWANLRSVIDDMYDPARPFQRALALGRSSPVVYYGFPHVPLATLAGFLFREQAEVHLVEHDRETSEFRWPSSTAADGSALNIVSTALTSTGCAILRLGVSALVQKDLCVTVLQDAVALDLEISHPTPARGIIKSEQQLKRYVAAIRSELDAQISGNRNITALHVFAAVPVSLAFSLGQVLSNSGMPRTCVYNFRGGDTPVYSWALCLRDAASPQGLHLLGTPARNTP